MGAAVGAQPTEAAAFTSETAKAANRRAAEKADDRRRRDVSNLPNSEVAAATYNTTHWRSHANDPWEGAPTSVLWGREQVGTADLRLDAQVDIPCVPQVQTLSSAELRQAYCVLCCASLAPRNTSLQPNDLPPEPTASQQMNSTILRDVCWCPLP